MMVLARKRTQIGDLPDQPLQAIDAAALVGRDKAADLLGKIKQNRAGFENRDRGAAIAGSMVDDRRDAIVRRDFKKLGRELLTLVDVDCMNRVGKSRLFQEHGHLVTVGRGPVVQVDHGGVLSCCCCPKDTARSNEVDLTGG